MRKFVLSLAIVALLALPGLTFGQASLDVVENGTGNNLVIMDPAVSTVLKIDVLLNTAVGHNGSQYSVTTDYNGGGPGSGDVSWIYDPAVPFTNGTVYPIGDYVGGIGLPPWSPPGPGSTLAAVNQTWAESYFAYSGLKPAVTGGYLATYEIQLVGAVNPGDIFLITAGTEPGPAFLGNALMDANYGQVAWGPGAALTVQIIPEPTTLLLLFGALPFLRRRR
jgi:hypothetical protein